MSSPISFDKYLVRGLNFLISSVGDSSGIVEILKILSVAKEFPKIKKKKRKNNNLYFNVIPFLNNIKKIDYFENKEINANFKGSKRINSDDPVEKGLKSGKTKRKFIRRDIHFRSLIKSKILTKD